MIVPLRPRLTPSRSNANTVHGLIKLKTCCACSVVSISVIQITFSMYARHSYQEKLFIYAYDQHDDLHVAPEQW